MSLYLDKGIDPTIPWGAYASTLIQLIESALPNSTHGGVIFAGTTPSVTGGDAWHKRCVWIKTSAPNKWSLWQYDNDLASWIPINAIIGTGAINDPAQIVDGTITLAKLNIGAVIPNDILKVNGVGSALEYKRLDRALAEGIIVPSFAYGSSQFFIRKGTTECVWEGVNPAAFLDKSMPASKITPSGFAGQVAMILSSGSGLSVGFGNPTSVPTGVVGGTDIGGTYPNDLVLVNSGVTAATYGGAGKNLELTVDEKGRITAASDSGAVLKVAKCTYREASGVQGTFNTSQRFKLTTEDYDPSNIIALAGNPDEGNFTLGAGTYELQLISYPTSDQASPIATAIDLYNATDAAVVDSTNIYTHSDYDQASVNFVSFVTISGSKTFYYRYRAAIIGYDLQFTAAQKHSIALLDEVYTQLIVRKLA